MRPRRWWIVSVVCLAGWGTTQAQTSGTEFPRAPELKSRIGTLNEKADAGDSVSQFLLGLAYERGDGVAHDYAQAARWYTRAGNAGQAEAQNNLANLYATGKGVSQDDREAVKWFRRAAGQRHPAAQMNLGWMYMHGRGVPKDEHAG